MAKGQAKAKPVGEAVEEAMPDAETVEGQVEGYASSIEMIDKTAEREKTGEQKRTVRSVIPNYWHPDLPKKTTVGFPNAGVDCYRNVVFQMILHMPIFYNWLVWYKRHHAPEGHVCKLSDGTECRLCQLYEIARGYWIDESKSWMPTFKSFTHSLLHGWKPAGTDSEQDPAEYFEILYTAIQESTKPLMRGDLEDIFEVEIITAVRCNGDKPCNPTYTPRQQRFMMINLSGEEGDKLPEKPTLSDIIQQHFDYEDNLNACAECGGQKTTTEQIGSFPEILLVQLNRTSMSGKKIDTHVYLSEQLNIETRFMDERWGNNRKVISYKLTSVVLHHGSGVTRGHYSIGIKGKGDKWSKANDTQILNWDPEGPGGNPVHLDTGYLFTYRRLPTDDPRVQITEGESVLDPNAMQVDSGAAFDDGGVFEGFDSAAYPSVFEDSEPELASNILGDPKALGKLLDVMIPKVVDSYIARSANARHKEWEKWTNEWEKKRGAVQGPKTSAIGSDIGTGDAGDIVDWDKQRGRLQITLTTDSGKGAKVLDLEVQGMHYNKLQGTKRAMVEGDDEGEVEKPKKKAGMYSGLLKKVQGKAKEFEAGDNGKAKGKPKAKPKGKPKGKK
ncbi:unnamed protein product [Penicillium glandicola]